MKITRKIKYPNRPLNQNLDLKLTIFDEYTIDIPKMSHDLVDIGNQLRICVGSDFYAKLDNYLYL